MSIAKIPAWFPWFWCDWKRSPRVMALSPLAKHAYRSLLDSQWENAGKIPNQPKIFFKYADCTAAEWDSVSADVLQFFPEVDGGKCIANPKLAQEWDSTESRMKMYSVGGQRSAEAKKRNNLASTLQAPSSHLATTAQHIDIDTNKHTEAKAGAGAPSVSVLRASVKEVFDYYLTKTGRNPKQYVFTDKKRDKGVSRLKEFLAQCDGDLEKAVAMMRRAVDGICADPWEDRPQFREWDKYLFVNTESAEKWRNFPLVRVNGKGTPQPVTNDAADLELARQFGGNL